MGSGNPSVELAPLRGSFEINLDDFKNSLPCSLDLC